MYFPDHYRTDILASNPLKPFFVPYASPLNHSQAFTKISFLFCLKEEMISLIWLTISGDPNLSTNASLKLNQELKFLGGHFNIQSKALPPRE
jgi:hypothetical protein